MDNHVTSADTSVSKGGGSEGGPSLPGMIDAALKHHQAGRMEAAKEICQQVLARDKKNADAYHLLGVMACDRCEYNVAIELIEKACELRPDEASFQIDLGAALLGARKVVECAEAFWLGGNFGAAETVCRKALELAPDDPEAYVMLSRILADLGKPREVEDALNNAVLCLTGGPPGEGGGAHLPLNGPDLNGKGSEHATASQPNSFVYVVDIVGTCNLSCPSCPVGNLPGVERPKGFMETAMFEDIVGKITKECPHKTPELWLFNWGEPLLHPKLPELIAIAKAHGLPVMISSNLNSKLDLKEVIRAAPDSFKISLSGFSQEIYGQTHKRGNIETVKANMRKVRQYLDEFDSSIHVWVEYHIYRHNVSEIEAMRAFTDSLNFTFSPTTAFLQPLEKNVEVLEGLMPDSEKGLVENLLNHPLADYVARQEYKNAAQDCGLRTDMMTINHDGTVALCCGVYEPEHMLGANFTELPHKELQALKYQQDFCRTCYKHDLQSQKFSLETFKKISKVRENKITVIKRASEAKT